MHPLEAPPRRRRRNPRVEAKQRARNILKRTAWLDRLHVQWTGGGVQLPDGSRSQALCRRLERLPPGSYAPDAGLGEVCPVDRERVARTARALRRAPGCKALARYVSPGWLARMEARLRAAAAGQVDVVLPGPFDAQLEYRLCGGEGPLPEAFEAWSTALARCEDEWVRRVGLLDRMVCRAAMVPPFHRGLRADLVAHLGHPAARVRHEHAIDTAARHLLGVSLDASSHCRDVRPLIGAGPDLPHLEEALAMGARLAAGGTLEAACAFLDAVRIQVVPWDGGAPRVVREVLWDLDPIEGMACFLERDPNDGAVETAATAANRVRQRLATAHRLGATAAEVMRLGGDADVVPSGAMARLRENWDVWDAWEGRWLRGDWLQVDPIVDPWLRDAVGKRPFDWGLSEAIEVDPQLFVAHVRVDDAVSGNVLALAKAWRGHPREVLGVVSPAEVSISVDAVKLGGRLCSHPSDVVRWRSALAGGSELMCELFDALGPEQQALLRAADIGRALQILTWLGQGRFLPGPSLAWPEPVPGPWGEDVGRIVAIRGVVPGRLAKVFQRQASLVRACGHAPEATRKAMEALLADSARMAARVGRDLAKAVPDALVDAKLRHLEASLRARIRAKWGGDPGDEDWANALALLHHQGSNHRLLRRFLLGRWRGHPANRPFLQNRGWQRRLEVRRGRYRVYVETDPFKVFQMGNLFGTCLSVNQMNGWSTIANAFEANKQVLWLSDGGPRPVGRRLVVLTGEGILLGFHSYGPTWAKVLFDQFMLERVRAGAGRFATDAEFEGFSQRDLGDELALFAEWYDDGPERVDAWVRQLVDTPRARVRAVEGSDDEAGRRARLWFGA